MERESRWTAPSPDCPRPERWHAPDRAATEIEVSQFLGALCVALRPSRVLETGAYKGYTSQAIGKSLVGIGHLDSLEIDAALAQEARTRVEGLPVSLHPVSSLEFVPEEPLDLIFFDSEYGLRPLDIARFRRFASTRCIWALHDSDHEGPPRSAPRTSKRRRNHRYHPPSHPARARAGALHARCRRAWGSATRRRRCPVRWLCRSLGV
jgi:predicted O-methyltransferase YrrM